jgi:hypothetical protein|uniref:Uncharacterized protein n=1 Tax=Picea glauca TaxID=3330 RepID=A0A101LYM7_PICGL|nr:hypothetical protein ABT39_MTgene5927 [Picea glauca]QHR92033.1 hypothetical protein Q903MT_gene6069 [Picea sitchensis]
MLLPASSYGNRLTERKAAFLNSLRLAYWPLILQPTLRPSISVGQKRFHAKGSLSNTIEKLEQPINKVCPPEGTGLTILYLFVRASGANTSLFGLGRASDAIDWN